MHLIRFCLPRLAKAATALVAAACLSAVSQAQLVNLTATLSGAQETPPTPSTATGTGCFTFDTTTNTVTWNVQFSGLLAAQTAAHLHQGAPGVAGPVIVPIPNGSPSTGSASLTPAQAASLLAGNFYVNIHTNAFPGGEIRGQMLVTPAPTLICFGDGSSGPCPCGNNSVPGNNQGCLHSGGIGGKLVAQGGSSLACDTLQLCASNMLGANCIFLQGSTVPFGPVVFGDGVRCIGGTLRRLGIVGINGGGACFGGSVPIHVAGLVTPGTFGYQTYYRDPAAFCTAQTFNITNGVQATWVP